ncbi:MAG: DUF445 domain-containing protein [Hyphomonadaceae bacterium]|nr:DUF445 domain-containing protein [Hyphomonadaceae bacterium]
MRRWATGLLLAMSILFVFSHIWIPPGELWGDVWGYVRAFAEASMVGGLADWFAVSAIFRRPLGLPIPHTAVIPRNQPRIADAVGRFIADNFLKPELVAERVKDADLSEGLGKWLADPAQSGAVASELVIAIPTLLDTLDDDTVANFLRSQAADAAQGTQVAPAFGSVLEALAEQGRHQALLDTGLKEGFRLLQEYQGLIRVKVRERSGWLARLAGIDQRASESIVRALEDLIYDAVHDPHHPIRERINDIVTKFARDLKEDPVLQARIGSWLREAAAHPTVAGVVEAGWSEFKSALRRDCEDPNGRLRDWLAGAMVNLGAGLLREPEVRSALNARIRALLVDLAARHGEDVAKLVSETIRDWDTQTIVSKLETNVGQDLQFIRLNGTVIGGTVGLLLHTGSLLLG